MSRPANMECGLETVGTKYLKNKVERKLTANYQNYYPFIQEYSSQEA